MTPRWLGPRFAVLRSAACVQCGVCAEQCAHGVHQTNPKTGALTADAARCVNCQRCVACCPVGALQIAPAANRFGSGPVWGQSALEEVYRQAQTGGVLLSAMGSPRALPVYWDSLVLNASQVTNPSIDPLREPMETAVYLGKRPAAVRRTAAGALDTTLPPQETQEQTAQIKSEKNTAKPQRALEQIYSQLGKRIGLVEEPTAEQIAAVVGLDAKDYEQAYIRYVETDFGADDVYIVLPKEGKDEEGVSHRENILSQLRERKDFRTREFANYDVYNSASIAENALIFERGGYVVMLMLEDNDSARSIIEKYIPERLNLS